MFTVNDASDRPDFDLSDDVADVDEATPGTQTTLRAAIDNANLTAGPHTIEFDFGDLAPIVIEQDPANGAFH